MDALYFKNLPTRYCMIKILREICNLIPFNYTTIEDVEEHVQPGN